MLVRGKGAVEVEGCGAFEHCSAGGSKCRPADVGSKGRPVARRWLRVLGSTGVSEEDILGLVSARQDYVD